ncbi:MAG TPA: hypothetical protein VHM67_04200 [Gemmatimonadaceae bacterium]|nr:hypothetical protein [Gemmatimonadaceae bacterium]
MNAVTARRSLVILALTFVAGAAFACSGGSSQADRRSLAACHQRRDSATWQAVIAYAKSASPYPQRFLSAAGTDSALPDAGVAALQEKGPTYFFPPDTAQRAKVRKHMDNMGPYTALLVAWHGATAEADSALVVRLSGRYVGGKFEGTVAPMKAFRFNCANSRWVLRDSAGRIESKA